MVVFMSVRFLISVCVYLMTNSVCNCTMSSDVYTNNMHSIEQIDEHSFYNGLKLLGITQNVPNLQHGKIQQILYTICTLLDKYSDSKYDVQQYMEDACSVTINSYSGFKAACCWLFGNASVKSQYDILLEKIVKSIKESCYTIDELNSDVCIFLGSFIHGRGNDEQRAACRRVIVYADCMVSDEKLRFCQSDEKFEKCYMWCELIVAYKIAEMLKLNNGKESFAINWRMFYDVYLRK